MAEYVPTNFATAVTRGTCRHIVLTPHRSFEREVIDWCEDPSRPGRFWVSVDGTFRFSDEQVAFEFKMRWG